MAIQEKMFWPTIIKSSKIGILDMSRGIRNPGVRQCLGFGAADSWTYEDQKSTAQQLKHCLIPGFLVPLDMSQNQNGISSRFSSQNSSQILAN